MPQGSILGPILFTIYVNDLKSNVNDCLLIQYADDTQFIHSEYVQNLPELIRKTEETLERVRMYFNNNGLLLNTKKTQCMLIGSRAQLSKTAGNIVVQAGDAHIQLSDNIKNLGMYFDKHMLFENHITELCKKSFGILMYINRIKDLFSSETRTMVVQTLVLNLMNYGMAVWGTTSKTLLTKVQKLQNFAAKVAVGGRRRSDRASPILKDLGWLNIRKKCVYEQCLVIFNILSDKYPHWLFTLPTVNNVHNNNTRQQELLYVKRTTTDYGQRSLLIRGPRLWNNLPQCIKDVRSEITFKKKLKDFIMYNDIPL